VERRPAARILRFLADSEGGLEKLIHDNTKDKEVTWIKKSKKEYSMFGAWMAEVRYVAKN